MMKDGTTVLRPWSEELVPDVPNRAKDSDLLFYIACAANRLLEVMLPEGAEIRDGELHLPGRD